MGKLGGPTHNGMSWHARIRMVFLLLLVAIGIIQSVDAGADELDDHLAGAQQELEQRQKMIQCIGYGGLALQRYIDLVDSFTAPDARPTFSDIALDSNTGDFNRNLGQNLSALLERHRQFRTKFADFLKLDSVLAPTLASDFKSHMERLNAETDEINNFLARFSRIETLNLYYLSLLQEELTNTRSALIATKAELISNQCSVINVEKPFEAYIKMTDGWINSLDYQARFIASLQKINSILVNNALRMIQANYESRIKEKLGDSFLDVWYHTLDLLGLEKVLDKKLSWEAVLAAEGLDNGLYNKNLQYEASLVFLSQRRAEGTAILDTIESYKNVTNIDVYRGQVARINDAIGKRINDIESKGWQGTLKRQIFLNEARLNSGGQLSLPCRKAIRMHITNAAKVKSFGDYRLVESMYLTSQSVCNP